ncbi:hypothetical protein M404DRAFT_516388 [Pisolithus tinctorius Marx 270]|uniref:Uncharacterized protein n=1 Tax=Pisolithus tinctorius Marx 270 TaxID=870435 RepID=A0A0C3NBX3_PISTI|nr:hypothetical protein M404DRAFT_516388 [Pisolithus tinctorius Marx 270]
MGWEGVSIHLPLTHHSRSRYYFTLSHLLSRRAVTSPISLSGHADPSCCVTLFGPWGYIYRCYMYAQGISSFPSFFLSPSSCIRAYAWLFNPTRLSTFCLVVIRPECAHPYRGEFQHLFCFLWHGLTGMVSSSSNFGRVVLLGLALSLLMLPG